MPVERRGWVIAFEIGSTGNGRNPVVNGRRQPSCDGTSRMTRECQVRICERLGVKFPGATWRRHPLNGGVFLQALPMSDGSPGVALVPAAVEVLGDFPELHDEVAR